MNGKASSSGVSGEKDRRKDRSRSKSPFRSFRWKKSPKAYLPGHYSDDESERAGDEEVHADGTLIRKHEWENTTTKASNRSWDKVYTVLKGTKLYFYKDSKTSKAAPEQTFKGEAPLNIRGAKASVASDYKKKKHVFRLKLESGAEFLLQGHDDPDMNNWIARITAVQDADSAGPSRSQTLPASAQKEDAKKRSFFTLKKS